MKIPRKLTYITIEELEAARPCEEEYYKLLEYFKSNAIQGGRYDDYTREPEGDFTTSVNEHGVTVWHTPSDDSDGRVPFKKSKYGPRDPISMVEIHEANDFWSEWLVSNLDKFKDAATEFKDKLDTQKNDLGDKIEKLQLQIEKLEDERDDLDNDYDEAFVDAIINSL